ncbi:hypothetical protein [Uliginosibacterium gangwonense]|uniref:hypothetical protein n=1 Tax=Uliginosibacterium gangwonense TaxID=392736 RepID=UPI0003A2B801|nr:hypothetical protein [Uliginosibacterium gangwonense]
MTQFTPAYIEQLCDDWCLASVTSEEKIETGSRTEKFRLLANGVNFYELSHETLSTALIGLSKVLLRPGFNTFIDHDHYELWSWCGELLLNPRSQLFPPTQHEIKSLYETSIHAALANCRRPPASVQETMEQWQTKMHIQALQPHHAKLLLQKSHLVLAYLSFPLLEAVLKRACATFVAFDGQVLSAFSVPNKKGNPKSYDPNGKTLRDRQCSSLRDLLFLHKSMVAPPQLKVLLDKFCTHLSSLDGTQDPFDLLYRWRNQSLHGSTNIQTIGGSVLNLSLLISLFEMESGFEQYRLEVLDHCRRESQSSHKNDWSFYPPY